MTFLRLVLLVLICLAVPAVAGDRGWMVSGRVVRADGAPVAGARVTALPVPCDLGADGRPVGGPHFTPGPSTTTDSAGRFVLARRDADRDRGYWYRILVRAGDLRGDVGAFSVVRGGGLRTEDVVLAATRDQTVVVLAPEGTPVAGARVRLRAGAGGFGDGVGRPVREERTAVADEEGRAAFRGLPAVLPEPPRLRVSADGFLPVEREVGVDDVVVRLRSAPPPIEVRGRLLTPAGEPARDHPVALASDGEARARTGPDGSFALEVAPATGATLHLGRSRLGLSVPRVRELPGPGAGAKLVDLGTLELAPPARVGGRVLGPDGGPAVGVDVLVRSADAPHRPAIARTDEAGSFELRLPRGLPLEGQAVTRDRAGEIRSPWTPVLRGAPNVLTLKMGGTVLLVFPKESLAPKVWIDGDFVEGVAWSTDRVRLRAPPGHREVRVVAAGRKPVTVEAEFAGDLETRLPVFLPPR